MFFIHMIIKFLKNIGLVFILLCACNPLASYAREITLIDAFKTAKKGDYVVCSQGKNMTLFHVFDVQKSFIIIEEITAPLSERKNIQSDWQTWVNDHAPGHLSWVMYEFDLETHKIEEMYSFLHRSWQKVYPQEQIFPILMDLHFKLIADSERKKTGPKPPLNIPDERTLWNPPIFLQGKKIKGIECRAYQAYWPNDGSELGGKKIEIFLPKDNSLVPSYFPVWIQASNQFAQAKMRVIDSGFNLKSIYSHFPLPPLELVSQQFTPYGELQFVLKTHPSIKDLHLYIRDSENYTTLTPIPFSAHQHEKERKIKIIISNEDLNNMLKPDKLYYFTFEPHEHPHMSIETNKPIGIAKQYVNK